MFYDPYLGFNFELTNNTERAEHFFLYNHYIQFSERLREDWRVLKRKYSIGLKSRMRRGRFKV